MFLRLSITTIAVFLTLALSIACTAARSAGQSAPKHLFSGSEPGQPFQDPHGRYSLSIPTGWELTMTGNDPIFRNGSSWIQIRFLTGNSPSDAVDSAVQMFRSQFTTFNTINRGDTTIAGRTSHGLNIDGITSAGQRMSVLFTAQPEGKKQYFVLVSATPLAQAAQLNTSVMAMANSVRFGGE